jgi:sirohydrochlorin ferrochelatase
VAGAEPIERGAVVGQRSAILLVGHGSRVPESNEITRAMAERLRAHAPDTVVRFAFLELASPTFETALAECIAERAEEIVVQPFLLAPGRHSIRDLPELIENARAEHPLVRFRLGDVLGDDPDLVSILIRRIEAAD